MDRYEDATPEELDLYKVISKTRRKAYESLRETAGMAYRADHMIDVLNDLGRVLDHDDEMLEEAIDISNGAYDALGIVTMNKENES